MSARVLRRVWGAAEVGLARVSWVQILAPGCIMKQPGEKRASPLVNLGSGQFNARCTRRGRQVLGCWAGGCGGRNSAPRRPERGSGCRSD
jgi:hypothetical protein